MRYCRVCSAAKLRELSPGWYVCDDCGGNSADGTVDRPADLPPFDPAPFDGADYLDVGAFDGRFLASRLDGPRDAVLCRSHLEHAPDWRQQMVELHSATRMDGLCIVETLLPSESLERRATQAIPSKVLNHSFKRLGFTVVGRSEEGSMQTWVLRKTGGL